MALDISANGAKVIFTGGTGNIEITEFSDEGTPFDAPDVEITTNAKNLNGTMISSRTASVYPFSVTVIPGSLADRLLAKYFYKSSLQPNNGSGEALYCNCKLAIPAGVVAGGEVTLNSVSATFTNARPKSGPTGPSTSAEGRLAARTYNFEAEGFIPSF